MFEQELSQTTAVITNLIRQQELPLPTEITWSPIPFQEQWGFGTAAFFQIAAQEAKSGSGINVSQRAQEIAESILPHLADQLPFKEVRAENGYLNVYVNPTQFAQRVTENVLREGSEFGRQPPKTDQVMVEFAQPNTHHSFHIGHARNAILGEALCRLVEFAGYPTIRASYPGDIGLGVITCLWGYQKFYQGQEPEGVHERGQWLAKIYTESTYLLTEHPNESESEKTQREEYEAERRELYRRWDAGDPEIIELWKRTRQWSLDELEAILELLSINMDVYFFESEVDEPSKAIVEELIEKGIAEDERPQGPVIVRIDEKLGLSKEKYRTAVILRSDGTTLYLTKDLALAKQKFEQYQVDRSVYVVDVRQSLHFQQAFKILELWGFPQAVNCHHLAYGFVTLPEGAMSARKGNVVLFMDVYDEALRRVEYAIEEKNPDLSSEIRAQVVHQVGLGALIYSMLSVDNNKEIVFDWDTALSFDGRSGPYIQNAHVRASSILRRVDFPVKPASFDYALEPAEIDLIEQISQFPGMVKKAAEEYKPLYMAAYVYELARAFHLFYHAVRVLQAETYEIRNDRIQLTMAAQQTLANGMHLLGMEAPEQM